jgi:hypothetical protein
LEFIPSLYGSVIEHIGMKENPIVTTAYNIVKAFMVSNMPKLKTFNEEPINVNTRTTSTASQQQNNNFQHFFQFVKNNELLNQRMKTSGATGNNGNESAEESTLNNYNNVEKNDSRKKRFLQPNSNNSGMKSGTTKTSAARSSSSSPVPNESLLYDDFSQGFDEVVQEMIKTVIHSYHSLHYPIDLEGNDNPLLLKGSGGSISNNPLIASGTSGRRTSALKKK